ncbi:hypothetical protein DL96DRAFT_1573834 [Flagelloscypha sp. PMI_526]|nr:hypothetical protein DL96DRAFT_1573834 [Flagelloscypha sp. PMI_526]
MGIHDLGHLGTPGMQVFSGNSLSNLANSLCPDPRRKRSSSFASSFKPLPPLISLSALRLPSLVQSMPSSSLPSPIRSTFPLSSSRRRSSFQTSSKARFTRADTFFQSNNPYSIQDIPQSPRSDYSRTYSRTGARAPEPTFRRKSGWKEAWPGLSLALVNCSRRLRRLSAFPPGNHSRDSLAFDLPDGRSSIESLNGSSDRDLNTWLASRRESRPDSQLFIPLEEYERTGSWIHSPSALSMAICNDPRCDIHALHAFKDIICSPELQT